MSDEMLHAMQINEIEKTRVEILAELVMLQSEMMARLDRIGEQLAEIRDDIQWLRQKGEPSPGNAG